MKFRFNVNLTEKDYYEFNRFHLIKSEFGKKQILKMRIFVAVFIAVVSLGLLFIGDFTSDAFVQIIPLVLILIIVEAGYVKFSELILKLQLKSMKKTVKWDMTLNQFLSFMMTFLLKQLRRSELNRNIPLLKRYILTMVRLFIFTLTMSELIWCLSLLLNQKNNLVISWNF